MKLNKFHIPGRVSPWVVEYSLTDDSGVRRRKRAFFGTEKERDLHAAELIETVEEHGKSVLRLTSQEASDWQKVKDWCVQRGQEPQDAIRRFLAAEGVTEASRKFEDAAEAYIADKRTANVSAAYIDHLEVYLLNFRGTFADRIVSSIRPEELRLWLGGLGFGIETICAYRRYISNFFEFCILQGWMGNNPMKKVAKPRMVRPEPGILTVAEARTLFAVNAEADLAFCGLLALGAFAGLRASTVTRITPDQIDMVNRRIMLLEGRPPIFTASDTLAR